MRTSAFCRVVFFVLTAMGGLVRAQPAQWIVVAAPALRPALEPLIERRRAQGFKVVVIEATNVLAVPLQKRLNQLCTEFAGGNFILLVGNPFAVPTLPGTTSRMRGQIGGDYAFSLPANGRPTVAVGRFPAADAREAGEMVRKTLAFEDDTRPGAWRNRLFLFMGDPNGGAIANMMIDPALTANLAQLDPSWTLRAESATPSRFQMPAALLRQSTLASMEDGELFSIFLLHSSAPAMWLTGKNWISRDDLAQVKIPRGAGPFFTSGCFACQWQGARGGGFGQAAMRNPGGPVAVIGATGESYSAAGWLALQGLLHSLAKPPFPTLLGQYWLAIQAGLAEAPMDAVTFGLLDNIDGSNGKIPLADQRREHLEMWLLLGDPALRLPIPPDDISLRGPSSIVAGQQIEISGTLPDALAGASVRVTIERPLNSEAAGAEAASMENYARANDFILAAAAATLTGNHFTGAVTAPAELPWSHVVLRATAATSNRSALGVLSVPAVH